jgi:hypothetical protein
MNVDEARCNTKAVCADAATRSQGRTSWFQFDDAAPPDTDIRMAGGPA